MERGAPRVDRADAAVQRDADGVVELQRQAEAAREVDYRPAGENGHLDVPAAGPEQAVHDLVDGPVPADDGQLGRAGAYGVGGELAQLPRPLGHERVAAEP